VPSYITLRADDVGVPILTIQNSSSANAISIVLSVTRNVYVVPNEQFLATSTAPLQPESEFRLQPEVMLYASIGSVGQTMSEAKQNAIAQARTLHPMHRKPGDAPMVDLSFAKASQHVTGFQTQVPGTDQTFASWAAEKLGNVRDALNSDLWHDTYIDTAYRVADTGFKLMQNLGRPYALNNLLQRGAPGRAIEAIRDRDLV
jgi:hypothetical protein